MFTSIVVPLDLEPGGDRALPVATALAREAAIGLELITISSPNLSEESDRFELQSRADAARDAGAPTTATYVLHDNDPAAALVGFLADRPDALVVMGTRARSAVGEFLLGSVSEELLAHTHHPILVVGPHADVSDPCGRPTLVTGVDSPDVSDTLLPAVVTWQISFHGPDPWLVEVLPVTKEPTAYGDVAETSDIHRVATALARQGVAAEWEVARGKNPADALIDFADRIADAVIVVASGRWRDPDHAHRTSVARRLAHHAHHPVLVVPADPARLVASS